MTGDRRITAAARPPIVFVHKGNNGVKWFLGDHSIFAGLRGFYSDYDLDFYTDKMHLEMVQTMGEFFHCCGDDPNSVENKSSLLYQFFSGGPEPVAGTEFRAVIHLHDRGF